MNKDARRIKLLSLSLCFGLIFALASYLYPGFVHAQPNVTLTSISPASAVINSALTIFGINLNKCSPPTDQSYWDFRCNVQFHDIESRRTTISGTEASDTANTTVSVPVPGGLCPGTYVIRFGEVTGNNWSNTIPFTVLPGGTPLEEGTGQPLNCRFISSINPTSAVRGNTVVISGQNLDANVHFYELPSGAAVASAGDIVTSAVGTINSSRTQVTFVVPLSIPLGQYTVRVGPNQNDLSNGVPFTVMSGGSLSISNVRISNITASSAKVTWNTSQSANSQVEFCLSASRCGTNTPLDSLLTTSHVVNLSGLQPSTTYYVWAKSISGSGASTILGSYLFRTTSQPAPPGPPPPTSPGQVLVSNVQVINITRDSARVTWDTDRPSDSKVYSCLVGMFCFSLMAADSTQTMSHALDITGLRADKKYYIKVVSVDGQGLQGSSGVITFRTQPGLIISNVNSTVFQTSFTVTWDTNYPANSRIKSCTSLFFCYIMTYMTDPAITLLHLMTVTNLQAGTDYYYFVSSIDLAGYSARSPILRIRTSN